MKQIIFILFLAFTASAATAVAQDQFVPGIEDLPLMEGLRVEGDELVFDTPEGRIVQVEAAGPGSAEQIQAFYGEVLPQLGWQRTSKGVFARDNEMLSLVIGERNGRVRIQFSLSPR